MLDTLAVEAGVLAVSCSSSCRFRAAAEVMPVESKVLVFDSLVDDGSEATLTELVRESAATPSSTGHNCQWLRLASQYTSASSLRNPIASRFETHFAVAASSYVPLPKHAAASTTPGCDTYYRNRCKKNVQWWHNSMSPHLHSRVLGC
jgi:hypothetical protein